MPPLKLQLTRGLALFDCQDHYAVLGVPLNSDSKVIRKRYLRVARQLHPDSIATGINKDMASTILSKMVNPSYEFLSSASQLEEYQILLKLVAQRFSQDQNRYPIASAEAKQILQAQDIEKTYQAMYQSIAGTQFSALEKYSDTTEILSEINLAYLYRQDSPPIQVSSTPSQSASRASQPIVTAKTPMPKSSPRATNPRVTSPPAAGVNPRATLGGQDDSSQRVNYNLVDQYCRRAEELIDKACYLEAVRELKEVVEGNNPIDPNNSKVYTLLGDIYKEHMKQPVMAKPFYMKALKSDPENADLKSKLASITPSSKQARAKSTQAKGKSADSGSDKKKFGFLNFLSRKK